MKQRAGFSLATILFGLVFAGVGTLFLFVIAREFASVLETYAWAKVPATIHDVEIRYPEKAPRGRESGVFELQTRYEYEFQGQVYQGNQFRRTSFTNDSYETLADKQWQIAREEWSQAIVNPQDPNEAILERGSLWIGLLIVFPIPFVLIGMACLVGGLGFWTPSIAKPPAKSEQNSRIPVVFGGVFLLAGLLVIYFFSLAPLRNSFGSGDWVETPCKVLWSRVQVHDGDEGDTYSVDVFFEYQHEGATHRSNRYSFTVGSSGGRKSKSKIVRAYPAGLETTCFVDPTVPRHAVLDRSVPWGFSLLTGAFGSIFAIVGAAVLWGNRNPSRNQRR